MARCDPTPCTKHELHVKQQMFLLLWAVLDLRQVLNATIKPHAELFGLVKRPRYKCADSIHSALAQLAVRVRLLRLRIVAGQVCLGHNGMHDLQQLWKCYYESKQVYKLEYARICTFAIARVKREILLHLCPAIIDSRPSDV